MPQLDLNLTYPGENYYTGAAQNIAYAEERADELDIIEEESPEASGCQRVYYCAWADRFKFRQNLVGYAKVKTGWAGGSYPDATGWNGKYTHRVLPHGYHMGQKNEADDAFVDWVYAIRTRTQAYGTKEANDTTAFTPKAEYARITVQYAALDYDLVSDAGVAYIAGGTGSKASTFQEWLRYCRIVQKPTAQFFQYPQQALKLADYPNPSPPPATTSKGINFYPAVLDNIADFLVYIKDLPYDPIQGLYVCFGKLNMFSIFATPDNPSGQPPESLHLVGADITRLPRRNGQRYWDLMLGFRKSYNRDHTGAQVGHNYVRDLVTVGGVQKLRFFYVSNDGTTNPVADNPMIGLEDMSKIFWIP